MGQTAGKPIDPSNPSYSFLKEKISNIMSVENRPVISLLPDDTMEKAVELFHSHNVLSAPIIDKDGKCFGFFAVDTMIVSLQYFCQLPVSLQGDSSVSYSVRKDAKEQLEHRAKLFLSHKVIEALEKQRSSSSFHGIRGDQSLEEALHIFAAGCQRIAVINNSKRVLAILSQSTILRYIAEDPRRLGALETESSEHLGMPWHRIIKIPDTALVIDAADIMHDRGIYSLPVVDKDGKFVAHISISDLKLLSLNHDSFSQLLMPLVDFIKMIREKKGKTLNHLVSLPQASTLKDIVLKMTQEHVHQLYIVDANQSPVSLISMTKVCEKIFTASKLKNSKDSIKK